MKRVTRQRQEIQRVIEQADRPLSPREILLAGRQRIPGLGLATVYRNLRALQQEERIVSVSLSGQGPVYSRRRAWATQDHHFLCNRCRRVFEIESPSESPQVSLPEGFSLSRQEVRLYGECASCSRPMMAD